MPLEVKDLSVFLASGEVVTEHISFQIEKGKMLSIVGSSGAGKTRIEISYIPRNLITVIFYYQISLKPLKTLSLSQVSFPLLFPLYYIVP